MTGDPVATVTGRGTLMLGGGVNARSVVFDLFGDYVRDHGGEVRLRALVALMDCFDVPEPTVRVVAARMRKEGWLTSRREGRETVYTLTENARRLVDEKRSRIFARAVGPWDGRWHMVIYQVPESDRALREQLRKRLAWLGFGPLASSVWMSPHNRVSAIRAEFADRSVVRIDVFHVRSEGLETDREIANRAWDLEALDRDYAAFLARYRHRLSGYRYGALSGREALIERVRLLRDFRMFSFRDPDLPPELLPEGWSGRAAHEVFLEAHGLLRAPAEAFVDKVLRC